MLRDIRSSFAAVSEIGKQSSAVDRRPDGIGLGNHVEEIADVAVYGTT
ncbi:MAG: hypothetical protein PHP55_00285 [Methanoculleus sp.]|jgi:hypothetical protein|nr:hypothetical protein [Methanoculleus sp.]